MTNQSHAIFDLLTALAYFSIPISLLVFLKKRKLQEFTWVFICFILFILLCGITHFMHIVEYVIPTHYIHTINGIAKALTAAVSTFTAILLWLMIPKALLIPSPSQLEEANQILHKRTEEVSQVNQLLKREIKEHQNTTNKMLDLIAIIQSSSDAIIGVTLDGKISSWSLGASKIFGYAYEEIVGESYFKLIPHNQIKDMEQVFQDAKEGRRVSHCEMKHILKNGTVIDGSLTVSSIRCTEDEKEIIGVSIILRDVTEMKQLQDEMKKLAELKTVSQMAASISHEVRNPLTVVKGFNQLLRNQNLTEEQKNLYIQLSLEELDRAESIITDYLTFAKPAIEHLETLELSKELDYIVHVLNPYATMGNIVIQLEKEKEPLHILGESRELRQSLLNIMKNGIESMEPGGRLSIHVKKIKENAVITIRDTGKGMSAEQIEQLGTPYYSTKDKGTGLGTMVAFSIIKAMKSEINVDSEIGKGTCFTISIPLVDCSHT
jgi:PAS domain S-box-containing protein